MLDADPVPTAPTSTVSLCSTTEPVDVWEKLLCGELTLLPAESRPGGMGYEVVARGEALPLSALERAVVTSAVAGNPNKAIALDLGLSASSVTRLLKRGASKLGVPSTIELLRVAGYLVPSQRRPVIVSLTPAEKDIVALLRLGLRNDEIAALRSRSVRTIANQVATILRKLNHPSRRTLLVFSGRPRTDDLR